VIPIQLLSPTYCTKVYDSKLDDANQLVLFYAQSLLGTPYAAHTLEDEHQEWLTINIHELDCTTFVETLYALTRTTLDGRYSWRDYADNLEQVRYRDGKMGDYASRLHYISEWIVDNRNRGNLEEVTSDLPHATAMMKTIDYMTSHREAYLWLSQNDTMFVKIRNIEEGYRNHRIPYLKKSYLTNKQVKSALRSGDFVGLVTSIPGLDISHMGVIIKDEKGELYLLDASQTAGKVIIEDLPLYRYLSKSKSNIGIREIRIMR